MVLVLAVLALVSGNALAQRTTSEPTVTSSDDRSDEAATTRFEHSDDSRYWISRAVNFIGQGHQDSPSPYSGANSLRSKPEFAASGVMTLYTGYKLTGNLQTLTTTEQAVGHTVSNGLGLGGFSDPNNTRGPALGQAPYLARAMVRYSIPLGGGMVGSIRTPLDFSKKASAPRLEIIGGKFSLNDFFDQNDVSSNNDLQFMNFAINHDGAWDYAGNSRGYTYGSVIQLIMPRWTLRFGEALMPKAARSKFLEANLSRANSDNAELEFHPVVHDKFMSVIRLSVFHNHASMGSFRDAILASQGAGVAPDITAHQVTANKYGFGANIQQNLGDVRLFVRGGWSDGRYETLGYTEVDRTGSFGGDLKGSTWHRDEDKVGTAFVVNALSGDHRRYLALDGMGTWIGDGRLNYATEKAFESYYTMHCWNGIFLTADVQRITNPAYNRDRRPILMHGFRLHVDF
jgi:high affinity Mn2+ porin